MKTGGVIITGIPTIGRAIERGEEEDRREGRRDERTEREEKEGEKSTVY